MENESMKQHNKKILSVLLAMVLFFTFAFMASANEEAIEEEREDVAVEVIMTVTGFVNDHYQIEGDDGENYEIGEGETGDELVQLVGEKVNARGNVIKEDGLNFMTVNSFDVLNE
jgi:hypothetical protein